MRLSRLLPHSLLKDFVSLTYQDAVRRRLVAPFIVFISFLSAFIVTRLFSYSLPSVNFVSLLIGEYLGGYYIHHFYFGIVLLAVAGWIALITNRQGPKFFAAAMFGIGLGILADELGLILTCTSPLTLRCDYHARITWDIFISIAGIFLSVLYLLPALRGFKALMVNTHRFVNRKINGK